MPRKCLLITALLLLGLAAARPAQAQQWQPPSRQMPAMPQMSELAGDWMSPRAPWFSGVAAISAVQPADLRAVGERARGSERAQLVRFSSGPMPVVVWHDRNGDGTADMIEIYRSGGVVIQLIDADYDGQANVLRVYDGRGTLVRQERY